MFLNQLKMTTMWPEEIPVAGGESINMSLLDPGYTDEFWGTFLSTRGSSIITD